MMRSLPRIHEDVNQFNAGVVAQFEFLRELCEGFFASFAVKAPYFLPARQRH